MPTLTIPFSPKVASRSAAHMAEVSLIGKLARSDTYACSMPASELTVGSKNGSTGGLRAISSVCGEQAVLPAGSRLVLFEATLYNRTLIL